MTTDIEIARRAKLKPVVEIAEKLELSKSDLIPFGHDKAKLSRDCVEELSNQNPGKLILVTAMSPTPAGEGKTTTSVGLTD